MSAVKDEAIRRRLAANCRVSRATGCWLWSGCRKPTGYGQLYANGRTRLAHRVSYEVHVEPIPRGLCVLHKCDTPGCINPDHLFVGTQADNVIDMVKKGRRAVIKGEEVKSTNFTEDDIRAIRADPRSNADIAADYGVTRTAIWSIKRRDRWAHVKDRPALAPQQPEKGEGA